MEFLRQSFDTIIREAITPSRMNSTIDVTKNLVFFAEKNGRHGLRIAVSSTGDPNFHHVTIYPVQPGAQMPFQNIPRNITVELAKPGDEALLVNALKEAAARQAWDLPS